jgi:hypothetical protein
MRDKNGRLIYVTPDNRCETLRCGHAAFFTCTFELRGKRDQEVCGSRICVPCENSTTLCPSHQRLSRAWAEKQVS